MHIGDYMISNVRFCCKQCLNPNEKFYLELRNETSMYLNATLIYSFLGKDVTRATPPFGPGKTERIVFPDTASCIFFQVFQTAFNPPALICTNTIPNNIISYFKIKELQPDHFICIKI